MISLFGCSPIPERSVRYHYQKPDQSTDFSTADLMNVGMDTSRIIRLTELILADSIPNTHSLLIYKDSKLVYENYFAGKDQKYGKGLGYIEHSAYQLHDCRSISKSVVSACLGIALQNGMITSIDEPLEKYFPELRDCNDSVKKQMTIRHLLTMTSGLSWQEVGTYGSPFNPEIQMNLRFNPIKYILKKPVKSVPGTAWNYNGGNTQLLAEIIARQSGLTIDRFAEKYLFAPLDIKHYEWVPLALDERPEAASGLRLSSRDMLKFGVLYMNKGKWNGEQILDSTWVEMSLKDHVRRTDLSKFNIKGGGYGYQFWTYSDTLGTKPIRIIEAKGNGGQSILFCSSLNLMIVTTAGNYNRGSYHPYLMFTKYVIPAIN